MIGSSSIYAAVVFASLDDIPSPKAWDLQEDGSVLIAGSARMTVLDDGTLDVRERRRARPSPFPS